MTPDSPIYRKAFENYLRKGTPVEIYLAASARPTLRYTWRTAGDDKVRPSHAANEGQVFAWDNPPPTGNPGDEPGCRCEGVPYYGIYDPPIEPAYPELVLIPLLRVSRSVMFLMGRVLRSLERNPNTPKPEHYTAHGSIRAGERKILPSDYAEAIRTAKEAGNVTKKIGKYGTPQLHYRGDNGITVVVETSGRNAGKVITFWYTK